MSSTLIGWSFWGTPGFPGSKAAAQQPPAIETRSNAGTIRVRAERPRCYPKTGVFEPCRSLLPFSPLPLRRGSPGSGPHPFEVAVRGRDSRRRGKARDFASFASLVAISRWQNMVCAMTRNAKITRGSRHTVRAGLMRRHGVRSGNTGAAGLDSLESRLQPEGTA